MKIFISYRRNQHAAQSDVLYDCLTTAFGKKNVFLDRVTLPLFTTFEEEILAHIKQADIFIILLAQEVLQDLQRPDDWVRREIVFALQQPNIRILPVLIDTPDLTQNQLPTDCIGLLPWQNIKLSSATVVADSKKIVKHIHHINQTGTKWLLHFGLPSSAGLLLVVLFITWLLPTILDPPKMLTVIKTLVAPNNTSTTVSADCPSGTHLLSGGYAISDPAATLGTYFPQASYPSDSNTWTVAYTNETSDAQNVSAISYCLSTLFPVTTRLVTQADPTPSVSAQFTYVSCPNGMSVTGGGFNIVESTSGAVIASAPGTVKLKPTFSPQGWGISTNDLRDGQGKIVYALCASANIGGLSIKLGSPQIKTIAARDTMPITVGCSANQLLVGGAFTLPDEVDAVNIFVTANEPVQNQEWSLHVNNPDGLGHLVQVYPLCMTLSF